MSADGPATAASRARSWCGASPSRCRALDAGAARRRSRRRRTGRSRPFPVEGASEVGDAFHLTAFEISFVGGDYGSGPADVWFRLKRPLRGLSDARDGAGDARRGGGFRQRRDRTSSTVEQFLFVNLDLSDEVTRKPRRRVDRAGRRGPRLARGSGPASPDRAPARPATRVVGNAAADGSSSRLADDSVPITRAQAHPAAAGRTVALGNRRGAQRWTPTACARSVGGNSRGGAG